MPLLNRGRSDKPFYYIRAVGVIVVNGETKYVESCEEIEGTIDWLFTTNKSKVLPLKPVEQRLFKTDMESRGLQYHFIPYYSEG